MGFLGGGLEFPLFAALLSAAPATEELKGLLVEIAVLGEEKTAVVLLVVESYTITGQAVVIVTTSRLHTYVFFKIQTHAYVHISVYT